MQLKIHNTIGMKFIQNQKMFHLGIKKTPTLNIGSTPWPCTTNLQCLSVSFISLFLSKILAMFLFLKSLYILKVHVVHMVSDNTRWLATLEWMVWQVWRWKSSVTCEIRQLWLLTCEIRQLWLLTCETHQLWLLTC